TPPGPSAITVAVSCRWPSGSRKFRTVAAATKAARVALSCTPSPATRASMATHFRRIADYLAHAFAGRQVDERSRLQPRHGDVPPRVPGGSTINDEALEQRWTLPALPASARSVLADPAVIGDASVYARNIENFIGVARLPIGLAGPVRVNGA